MFIPHNVVLLLSFREVKTMIETKIRRMYLFGFTIIFMLAGLVIASKFAMTIDMILQFLIRT